MGTRKDENSDIDEDAIHVVEGILRGGDWGRSKPEPDKVGLDMLVNLLENRHPIVTFFLQIKGMGPKTREGKKVPQVSRTGTLDRPIELEHLDYYMKLSVPVFLVVVDVVKKVAHYVHIQHYIEEELKSDDWRERLHVYKETHAQIRLKTKPTKTIRVPVANKLSDTPKFKDAVRDAHGYMASLAIEPGIAYREGSLARLDERFEVRYVRNKDGEGFQIDAKRPVEMKLRGKMPKTKFEDLFGKGLRISLAPGELSIEGSPLWEKVVSEANAIHIKRFGRGFIDIVRLDAAGEPVLRIDSLYCEIEGGWSECRFKAQIPSHFVTLEFSLDLEAMSASPESRARMKSTFALRYNLATMQGRTIESLDISDDAITLFSGIMRSDQLRIDVSVEGIGRIGGFNPPEQIIQLLSSIGTLYEALKKAKAIATYFKVSPKLPASLGIDDLRQIDLLYELIQGREVLSRRRIDNIKVWVRRDRLAAAEDPFGDPNSCELALASEADLPFLGVTVHLDQLVRVISRARLITRRSDIKRLLRQPGDSVKLRFATTPESKQTLKLAD